MHGLGHVRMVDLGYAAAADVVVEAKVADLPAEAEAAYDTAAAAAAAVAAGPNTGGSLGRWKGQVINRVPSCTSWTSLSNIGLFGQLPRKPAIMTGLPPLVWPAMAALSAAVESISSGRGNWQ